MPRTVFIRAFEDGHPVPTRTGAVVSVAGPYVVGQVEGVASLQTADGGADVWGYGDDGGLVVVDATGAEIWDIVVAIAQVAGAVIIPMGEGPIVVDALRIADLPEDVRMSARLVTSGAELMRALEIGRGVPDS